MARLWLRQAMVVEAKARAGAWPEGVADARGGADAEA